MENSKKYTEFYKLDECLKSAEKEGDDFIFAMDVYYPEKKKVSKKYSHCKDAKTFFYDTSTINPTDKCFYEIIKGDKPHKLFADLEWPLSWKTVEEVKNHFCDMLNDDEFSGYDFDTERFVFLNASNVSKNKGSLHVIGDYYFENIGQQNMFWSNIKTLLFQKFPEWCYTDITNSNIILKSYIDFCVYNKNRQFRLPENSKMNSKGKLERPLMCSFPLTEDTFQKYYISAVSKKPEMVKVDINPIDELDFRRAGKRETQYNIAKLNEFLKKYNVEIPSENNIKNNMIILKNSSSIRKCPINGEDNISDNAYLVIRKDGVHYCCHDEGCKNDSILIQEYKVQLEKRYLEREIPFLAWQRAFTQANETNLIHITNKVIDSMNDYFIVIAGGSKPIYLYRTITENNIEKWNMKLKYALIEQFEVYKIVHTSLKLPSKDLINLWLNSSKRRTYNYIDAFPLNISVRETFNMFSGLVIDKDTAISKGNLEEGQIVGDFILNHWCHNDLKVFNYVIRWLAHQVQNPFVKLPKCIVLKGIEGSGKGSIVQLLKKIIGEEWFFHPTNHDDVIGQYNFKLRNKSLIFMDEMTYGGNKKEDGVIKKLITEDSLTTNEKFVTQLTTTNRMNIIMASNNDWIIPVGLQARRYVVLDTGDGMRNLPKGEREKIYNCNPYSFAKYLYSIDLSNWDSNEDIITQALIEQKEQAMHDVVKWVYESIKYEGNFPFEQEVEKKVFYELFKNEFPASRVGKTIFYRKMDEFKLDIKETVKALYVNDKRTTERVVKIPSKEDFEKAFKVLMRDFLE